MRISRKGDLEEKIVFEGEVLVINDLINNFIYPK